MTEKLRHGRFGYHAYHRHLPPEKRLKAPCADCPFTTDFHLAPGRLEEIEFSLSMGQPFWCHKTVYQPGVAFDDDGNAPSYDCKYRMCEGAARWLEAQMSSDGIDQLAQLLEVQRGTVLRYLRDGKLSTTASQALRRHDEPYWLGCTSDGRIDLVVRCHWPQMVVIIDPEIGPAKRIDLAETSKTMRLQLMREVMMLIGHQYRAPWLSRGRGPAA
jgi:hypothetical protein